MLSQYPSFTYLRQALAAFGVLALLLSASSCVNSESKETVTVIVTNLPNQSAADEVLNSLKNMYDPDARFKRVKSTYVRGTLTVELAPVTDIERLKQHIRFGEVGEIEGRKIQVRYTGSSGVILI